MNTSECYSCSECCIFYIEIYLLVLYFLKILKEKNKITIITIVGIGKDIQAARIQKVDIERIKF